MRDEDDAQHLTDRRGAVALRLGACAVALATSFQRLGSRDGKEKTLRVSDCPELHKIRAFCAIRSAVLKPRWCRLVSASVPERPTVSELYKSAFV